MSNPSFTLRHAKTGLFFNGTNFSEENANKATRFASAPDAEAVKLVWDIPVQIIAITDEQIAKLDKSDRLDERAAQHRREARAINNNSVRAQREGAATRLSMRATKLAVEVYATFPRTGFNVAS